MMRLIPTFKDYCISETYGFLLDDPLLELPEYFAAWNVIGKNVATLIEGHHLRSEVHKMSLLDCHLLGGYRQWRLAYMLLSFIGNGYIWQEGDDGVATTVPSQLSIPWYGTASHLGLHTAMSHSCFVLSNWCLSADGLNVLEPICLLPGGTDCVWFVRLHAQLELDAVPGLKAILSGMQHVLSKDVDSLRQDLADMSDSVRQMTRTMNMLNEKVDPNIFYTKIRPFLSGWGGSESPLPNGVIYSGMSDVPEKVIGGSGAQSSTLQCFDAALGITHKPEEQCFVDKMKSYMPPAHRDFIDALLQAPSVQCFVDQSQNVSLLQSYNECVNSVASFRTSHIQMVAKYIVLMARKWKRQEKYECVSKQGTGGQALIPFVKTLRDTTRAHLLHVADDDKNLHDHLTKSSPATAAQ